MTAYMWRGWLIILSCWMMPTLAAPETDVSASTVPATNVVAASTVQAVSAVPASAVTAIKALPDKVSDNPVKDYEEGLKLHALGVKGDMGAFIDATERFRLAANAGHAGAQAYYGLSLERGQFPEVAVKYYRLSADQGNVDGQYYLGLAYMNGEGIAQDLGEARKWLILAGEQGHKQAIDAMAGAYLRQELTAEKFAQLWPRKAEAYTRNGLGLDEAARRGPEALVWIQRAADNDSIPALNALAAAYRDGQYGLAVDTQKADEIVAKIDRLRGVAPEVGKKKSALYRLLRGDDSEKQADTPK